jgi:predicted DsbA family dithiol-disulfide isomerase
MSDINNSLKLVPRTVLHWYDFICPFCYVGQNRTAILRKHGLEVIELPFQAHSDIPSEGIPVGPRNGPMYASLEREAESARLTINWPHRLANTRRALAAAEWVRQHQPKLFSPFQRDLFAAHFVLGENLGDPAVIDRHATEVGIDVDGLRAALTDGVALAEVKRSESLGHMHGVRGTPVWLLGQKLISGLRSTPDFERLAQTATPADR